MVSLDNLRFLLDIFFLAVTSRKGNFDYFWLFGHFHFNLE